MNTPLTDEIDRLRAENTALRRQIEANDDTYVAWCRYRNGRILLCDSDSPGAFKVYRHPRAQIDGKAEPVASKNDKCPMCGRYNNDHYSWCRPELLPAAQGIVLVPREQWGAAYLAFRGCFDTPLARRRDDSEYANDARRRLRELNDLFSTHFAESAEKQEPRK